MHFDKKFKHCYSDEFNMGGSYKIEYKNKKFVQDYYTDTECATYNRTETFTHDECNTLPNRPGFSYEFYII